MFNSNPINSKTAIKPTETYNYSFPLYQSVLTMAHVYDQYESATVTKKRDNVNSSLYKLDSISPDIYVTSESELLLLAF